MTYTPRIASDHARCQQQLATYGDQCRRPVYGEARYCWAHLTIEQRAGHRSSSLGQITPGGWQPTIAGPLRFQRAADYLLRVAHEITTQLKRSQPF